MSEQLNKPTPDNRSAAEIEADIARTRLELTGAVDDLADRLDPRKRIDAVRGRVDSVRSRVDAVRTQVKEQASSFTTDLKNRKPRAIGIAAGGAAALVLVILLARRGE